MEDQYVRCLMVETGQEDTVCRLLNVRNLGHGVSPLRVRVRKIRGVWQKDRIRLLPGYVFVFSEEDVPVRSCQGLEHVLKVLRYEKEPDGYLRGSDLDFARTVRRMDGQLDVLDAVDEAGFIRVTDALLQALRGEVVSVRKGKRQAVIRVNLMGRPKLIEMNYQLLDADGNVLTPAAEEAGDGDNGFRAEEEDEGT